MSKKKKKAVYLFNPFLNVFLRKLQFIDSNNHVQVEFQDEKSMFNALDMNELVRKNIEIFFETELIIQEDMNYVYLGLIFLFLIFRC